MEATGWYQAKVHAMVRQGVAEGLIEAGKVRIKTVFGDQQSVAAVRLKK